MSQADLLKLTFITLDRLGIPSMLTGSLASSIQGEPRSTHDIDVVIDLASDRIDDLIHEFPAPDFYLNRSAMEQAISHQSMFNLLSTRAGDKVDFWLLTPDEFDRSRFARRVPIDYEGVTIRISSPEDTILMKLRWDLKSGGNSRQFDDALRVFEMQKDILDIEYIKKWTNRLGLGAIWNRILKDAEPMT